METEKAAGADRRDLLKLTALVGLAGMVPVPASAQEQAALPPPARPLPTVDTRFPAEMAPGVFLVPDKRIPLVPNIGIVVGTESVLVIDCGLGIESAENVLRLARELAPGRRIILTVTHAHPEHAFGAQVFRRDARIYYNSAQRDYLQRSGQILLEGFRARILPEGHKHLLDGIELTPPDETYDTAESVIDLGGREVRLRTWGTAHSPGDQIVFLPQERILFAGDLLEERMFPIVPFFPPMIDAGDMDIARWETALNDMMRLPPRLIVPGHGNLAGIELPEAVLGYFRTMREMLAEAGPRTANLPSLLRARYATWENPEFISPALRYFQQRT
ncbi:MULTISPECIES: MBL fold metallo-hydrolase [unclassified Chelatococcus]|uniref:MBL fold metallo-hydrolase n=1 Tax=unclassified Chelatococcus TaxID=2638111 RepID=UPI0006867F2F|nr:MULTISPECIES: MBL fold metallo-hydrolase [unclassified Chelatococcus]